MKIGPGLENHAGLWTSDLGSKMNGLIGILQTSRFIPVLIQYDFNYHVLAVCVFQAKILCF